ncbi:MAG: hypothetical protein V3S25_03140 [Nitrospirales bacterium]
MPSGREAHRATGCDEAIIKKETTYAVKRKFVERNRSALSAGWAGEGARDRVDRELSDRL